MKSTLKRELKVRESVEREAIGGSAGPRTRAQRCAPLPRPWSASGDAGGGPPVQVQDGARAPACHTAPAAAHPRRLRKAARHGAPAETPAARRVLRKRGRAQRARYADATTVLRMLTANAANRPVLKHGPRSLTCVRVTGWQGQLRNQRDGREPAGAPATDRSTTCAGSSASTHVGTRKMVNYAWVG